MGRVFLWKSNFIIIGSKNGSLRDAGYEIPVHIPAIGRDTIVFPCCSQYCGNSSLVNFTTTDSIVTSFFRFWSKRTSRSRSASGTMKFLGTRLATSTTIAIIASTKTAANSNVISIPSFHRHIVVFSFRYFMRKYSIN